jgi:hypothetical protein
MTENPFMHAALTAHIAHLEAQLAAVIAERDALARELHLEKIHLDALLACTMPEDTAH